MPPAGPVKRARYAQRAKSCRNADRARTDLFKTLTFSSITFFHFRDTRAFKPNRETTKGRAVGRMSMSFIENGSFDPEAIALSKIVLDEAWANLLPEQQVYTSKAV